MIYHGTFDNPQNAVSDIVAHAVALNVSLVSVTVDQANVVVETIGDFPSEQLDHLGLSAV